MTDVQETTSAPRRRTAAPRKRKKKYPIEALVVCAVGAFFLGGLLMWASVFPAKRAAEETARRVTALESLAVATGDQVRALSLEITTSSTTLEAQGRLFEEQLASLSTDLSTQQSQLKNVVQTTDIGAAIRSWSPYVYSLTCYFTPEDGEENSDRGSATLERTLSGVQLITNKHVIERTNGTELEHCVLSKPGTELTLEVDASDFVKNDKVDYASAPLKENVEAMLFTQRCPTKPTIGDTVLILGYPAIGAKESITATEGIVSGFDADYYITSAKIEKGNSGGAAVDIRRNCFLGLPTLVFSGRIESIARILPVIGL